jgi:hypothetical protein
MLTAKLAVPDREEVPLTSGRKSNFELVALRAMLNYLIVNLFK